MSLVGNLQSFMMCAPIFHPNHAIFERSLRSAHFGPKMYHPRWLDLSRRFDFTAGAQYLAR